MAIGLYSCNGAVLCVNVSVRLSIRGLARPIRLFGFRPTWNDGVVYTVYGFVSHIMRLLDRVIVVPQATKYWAA